MIRRVSSNDKTKDSSIKDSSIKDSFFSIENILKNIDIMVSKLYNIHIIIKKGVDKMKRQVPLRLD